MIYDMVFQRQSFLGLLHIWTFAGSSSVSLSILAFNDAAGPSAFRLMTLSETKRFMVFLEKITKTLHQDETAGIQIIFHFAHIPKELWDDKVGVVTRRAFLGFVARITPLGRSSLTHTWRRSPTWTWADWEPYKFAWFPDLGTPSGRKRHMAQKNPNYLLKVKQNESTFKSSFPIVMLRI